MSLAAGNGPEPPRSRLRRMLQWIGFGALVCRFVAAGLWQWTSRRWVSP